MSRRLRARLARSSGARQSLLVRALAVAIGCVTGVAITRSSVDAAPPPWSVTERPTSESSGCAAPVRAGPLAADTVLRLHLDASAEPPLSTWLMLEQLVAERVPDVQLELVVVLPPHHRAAGRASITEDRVRRFTLASLSFVPPAKVLRLLARDGWQRIHAQLLQANGRASLARELDVSIAQLESVLGNRACWDQALTTNTKHLANVEMDLLGTTVRLPAVEIETRGRYHALVAADVKPSDIRAHVDAALRAPSTPGHPLPWTNEATTPDRFSPALTSHGVAIGGPGLPHTVVVLADGEEAAVLSQRLPPLLDFVALRPGLVALRVAAVGASVSADTLRRRLCRARELGRELDYLMALTRAPNRRGAEPPWFGALDRVDTKSVCADPPRLVTHPVTQEELAPGVWLDGEAAGRTATGQVSRLDRVPPPPPLWLFAPPSTDGS